MYVYILDDMCFAKFETISLIDRVVKCVAVLRRYSDVKREYACTITVDVRVNVTRCTKRSAAGDVVDGALID